MRWSLLLLAVACGGGSTPVACPDGGTALTWSGFGEPFFTTWCVECHQPSRASKGVTLDTQERVARFKAQVITQAGTGTRMPPTGSKAPTEAERARLAEYLSCGGP